MTPADDNDIDLLAAEYVIGTLDHSERVAFAARIANEPAADRAVRAWERRLASLADGLAPVQPEMHVWEQISRTVDALSLSPEPQKQKSMTDGDIVTRLRRSRDRWRLSFAGVGALAAALLVALVSRAPPAVEPGATYVAAVNRGGDKPALIVRVDLRSGQVLVRPIDTVTPAGHSLELWYIGDDKRPRSMGVVPVSAARLALPSSDPSANATFAVTVEPPGGSKTGGPTGPVVYAGQLIKEDAP
jgi:anti-sigma-K factor RskA